MKYALEIVLLRKENQSYWPVWKKWRTFESSFGEPYEKTTKTFRFFVTIFGILVLPVFVVWNWWEERKCVRRNNRGNDRVSS